MSRVAAYDGVGRNIPGHHRAGADNGTLTNGYAFKDNGIKANPDLVLYLDGSTVHAVPLFGAACPIAYIIFTLRPVQAVRIMIDDRNSPRYDDIAANVDLAVAHQMASPYIATITDGYLACIGVKGDVAVKNRTLAD
jgi:hypothetical protein